MKLIIAGTRTIKLDISTIQNMIDELISFDIDISEVVSGCSRGVDISGENWATYQLIPIKRFKANWEAEGRAAGPIRNKQMAEYADALLLVWNGESRGSANMKQSMLDLNKPIYEVTFRKA